MNYKLLYRSLFWERMRIRARVLLALVVIGFVLAALAHFVLAPGNTGKVGLVILLSVASCWGLVELRARSLERREAEENKFSAS